jgi:hypothetical protein
MRAGCRAVALPWRVVRELMKVVVVEGFGRLQGRVNLIHDPLQNPLHCQTTRLMKSPAESGGAKS